MNWTVFWGARPAVHLNVVENLHNIKMIPIFNVVKEAGPWQGMFGSAAQPSTWMFLKWLHNIQSKKFCNTVNRIRPCLEKHELAKVSNVFEKFHAIRTKSWLNAVNWAGPCLGEHDQPFIWTLLKICITSKRKESSTTRNELGRDRGCWRARPSHQLECFRNGCITSRQKISSTPWKELGRVSGSTTQPKFWMFLKSFTPSRQKVDSTAWFELDRVWGSTTSRSFERCWKSAKHQKITEFNAAKSIGPWQGMLGSAAQPFIWMFSKRLHNIQTKKFFNTMEGTGPCMGEQDPA